jgi:hypothetical protein
MVFGFSWPGFVDRSRPRFETLTSLCYCETEQDFDGYNFGVLIRSTLGKIMLK